MEGKMKKDLTAFFLKSINRPLPFRCRLQPDIFSFGKVPVLASGPHLEVRSFTPSKIISDKGEAELWIPF